MALLSLQQIHKTFEKGTVNENHVLRGLDPVSYTHLTLPTNREV